MQKFVYFQRFDEIFFLKTQYEFLHVKSKVCLFSLFWRVFPLNFIFESYDLYGEKNKIGKIKITKCWYRQYVFFFHYRLYKLSKWFHSYKPNTHPGLPLWSFLGKSLGNPSALPPAPLGSSNQAGRSAFGTGLSITIRKSSIVLFQTHFTTHTCHSHEHGSKKSNPVVDDPFPSYPSCRCQIWLEYLDSLYSPCPYFAPNT